MTTHPKTEYAGLSESEALQLSVDKGVTNGGGSGYGLWATSSLVRENGGTLLIHSGRHALQIENGTRVVQAPWWRGTYTFLRLNTDIPVTYIDFFGKDDTQKYNFETLKDDILNRLDDLWRVINSQYQLIEHMNIQFGDIGESFGPKILAAQYRKDIEVALMKGEFLVFDFSGVRSVSHTFAHECFAKLLEQWKLEELKERTTFKNTNEYVKKMIAYVFKDYLTQEANATDTAQ